MKSTNMDSVFANKVALVTGGSRGIGAEVCKIFAKYGAKVYVNYSTNEAGAKAVKNEIEAHGGHAECIHGDISNIDNVNVIFNEIAKKEGKLDILINNAGIKVDSLMSVMKNCDWDNVIQTNLSGAFYCSKAAVRLMLRNDSGVVINVASVSGIIGNYGQANYSSAKAGLIALTKTMCKELGRFNIRVNAVAPGLIQTEMVETTDEKSLKNMLAATPLGRIGAVDEVAKVIKFLASDEASYINGQCIVIDGGFSC